MRNDVVAESAEAFVPPALRASALFPPRRAATDLSGWVVGLLGVGVAVLFAVILWESGVGALPVFLAAAGMLMTGGLGIGFVYQARRQVREAREREAMWRAAGDALPFPCFVVDGAGRATYANGKFRERWPDALHSPLASLRQLNLDDAAVRSVERLEEAGALGTAASDEIRYVAPSGDQVWLKISVSPLSDNRTQVLWAVEDITARREMEYVLRDEQAKFVDFLENAPIGFYSVDPEGRFLLINRTLAEWLGTTAEEVRAKDLRLHDLIADRPPAGTPAMSPFPGVGESRGEIQFKVADGEVIHAFVSQTIVGNSDNGDMRTRSVVRNLSPERAWERALHRSEQRFQRFFEDAPVGIVLLDSAGKVIEANRVWRELVAPGHSQIVDSLLTEFVVEKDAPAVSAWLQKTLTDPEPAARQITLRTMAETGRRRDVTAYVSRIDEGLILHFLEAGDRRSADQTVVQGQKMQAIGQLAGGIAHDFNNLLTAMIGFCDLLLLRHSPGDQSFGDIMQIKQNASRAANLVRQLLAFSRQQTLQPKVLNITDILAELNHLLGRLIGANIKLNMVHGHDLGLVRVDQGQFEQVVINLAVNARDAMDQGGELTIRTRNVQLTKAERRDAEYLPAGDYVVVEVADTGHGIPADKLERIFEPFYTTKEVGQGTGLGLSTVYGIIKQTEGHVFVDSVVNEGTTFSIYLPHHRADESKAAEADEEAAKGAQEDLTGAGSVLLVEDEDAVRQFSARALRAKGYNVIEAQSGEDALDLLRSERVDLLITDVVMPEMDGPTLIRLATVDIPDLRIICISGYAEDAFRKRIGEDSAIHFLAKPFSLAQLASKVKEVLAAQERGTS